MNTYNILDFGARVCDRLQTTEIQKAIDTCFLRGGGRVVVPAGIFRTGGLRIRSNVELYLQSGAVLEGSTDPEDYTGYLQDQIEPIVEPEERPQSASAYAYSRWNNAIIRAIHAKNVSIIGEPGSYINGKNCFDPQGEEGYRGPHPINMWYCQNITLQGYTITDGGNWGHAIFDSQHITARDLTVYGGHDGFDIRTCDDVLIENCTFYTGDDCIAGFDNHDVIIRDCIFDTACSALRFGGNHVLIERCRAHAPSRFGFRKMLTLEQKKAGAPTDENCRHNMITGFLYYCDFRAKIRRTPGDILIRDCIFENPDTLFALHFDGNHIWCCNRSLSSITFERCTVTGAGLPMQVYGDAAEPLTLTIKDSTISAREGDEKEAFIDATNFERIHLENVSIEGYEKPTVICRSQGEVQNVNSTPVDVVHSDEPAHFRRK